MGVHITCRYRNGSRVCASSVSLRRRAAKLRVALVCLVWGEEFADFFARYCVPPSWSRRTFRCVSREQDVTLLLYTDRPTQEFLDRCDSFKSLSRFVKVELLPLEQLPAAARTNHWVPWQHAVAGRNRDFDLLPRHHPGLRLRGRKPRHHHRCARGARHGLLHAAPGLQGDCGGRARRAAQGRRPRVHQLHLAARRSSSSSGMSIRSTPQLPAPARSSSIIPRSRSSSRPRAWSSPRQDHILSPSDRAHAASPISSMPSRRGQDLLSRNPGRECRAGTEVRGGILSLAEAVSGPLPVDGPWQLGMEFSRRKRRRLLPERNPHHARSGARAGAAPGTGEAGKDAVHQRDAGLAGRCDTHI